MTYITARLTLFTGLGLLFRRLFFEFVLHYLKKNTKLALRLSSMEGGEN